MINWLLFTAFFTDLRTEPEKYLNEGLPLTVTLMYLLGVFYLLTPLIFGVVVYLTRNKRKAPSQGLDGTKNE